MDNVLRLPIRVSPNERKIERSFKTVHGYRRAYIKAGRGPELLMIHGIGDSADTWSEVVEELAKDHTVIAPDLLGHGASDKPRADYAVAAYANAMRDLLAVLDIERVTLVGHSLGGGIALQMAYQFPKLCERLVLVSTGGVSHEVNLGLRLASVPNFEWALPMLSTPIARQLGAAFFYAAGVLDLDIAIDAEPLSQMFSALPNAAARRAFLRTLRGAVDWRGQAITMLDRAYLAEEVPTMIVWGQRDAIISVEHAHRAHAALRQSRLEILQNTGHFPHVHQPDRFVQLLRSFNKQTLPYEHDECQWRERLRHGASWVPNPSGVIHNGTPRHDV
ncbi:MAG: alpha/beta hydrolase [Polyangiales bacterium]